MRVLVIGKGQLGSALASTWLGHGDEVAVLGRPEIELDLDPDHLLHMFNAVGDVADAGIELVFHTAALTRVNYCEEHPEEALDVNSRHLDMMLEALRDIAPLRFILFSTDYVFPGTSHGPILENAQPNPINAYGSSKLDAETRLLRTFDQDPVFPGWPPDHLHIVRTSGVFGPRADGSERNFFRAIYEKLSQTDGPIEVVDDQFTCVTYAPHLAEMLLTLLPDRLPKLVHLTSAGVDSWYGWARRLAEIAGFDPARIVPVPTEPGSPVKRPAYSVLGSLYQEVQNLVGQHDATKGIAEYVRLLQAR